MLHLKILSSMIIFKWNLSKNLKSSGKSMFFFCLYIQWNFFWLEIVIKHKTFHFSENLQASFSFPTQNLMTISRPPCGSGLLQNFSEHTIASSLPLYSKKYLQNQEISWGRCPTRERILIFLWFENKVPYHMNQISLSCHVWCSVFVQPLAITFFGIL